jgi:hypothetical protein
MSNLNFEKSYVQQIVRRFEREFERVDGPLMGDVYCTALIDVS